MVISVFPDTTFALLGKTSKSKYIGFKTLRTNKFVTPGALIRYSSHDQKNGGAEEDAKEKGRQTTPGFVRAQRVPAKPRLWTFVGSQGMQNADDAPEVHRVAAESLHTALRYMRLRNDNFTITEARFLGMIPLLSCSPSD